MKLFVAIFAWFDSVLVDYVSSVPYNPEFPESNAFWRHANGSIWPSHAIVHSSGQCLELAVYSWLAWLVGSCINERCARAAAIFPWAWYTYIHFQAAISNFLIYLGYYVPLNFVYG